MHRYYRSGNGSLFLSGSTIREGIIIYKEQSLDDILFARDWMEFIIWYEEKEGGIFELHRSGQKVKLACFGVPARNITIVVEEIRTGVKTIQEVFKETPLYA